MAIVQVTKNTYTVDTLYQWDKGQTLAVYGLSLPSVPEMRFCHKGADRSIVRQATMDAAGVVRAEIPDSLLQQAYTIWVYIGLYEGKAFRTRYKIEIPVKAQAKPHDYTLEDGPEVYSFDQLENQVANALVLMTDQHREAMDALNKATADINKAKDEVAAAAGTAVVELTHLKNSAMHILTGLKGRTGLVPAIFKTNERVTEGDTFTIDGVAYTAQTIDGKALTETFWTRGATVACVIDTEDKVVNFKGGGGPDGSYRIYLDSASQKITQAQYGEAEAAIKAGRMVYLDIAGDLYTYYPRDGDVENGDSVSTLPVIHQLDTVTGRKMQEYALKSGVSASTYSMTYVQWYKQNLAAEPEDVPTGKMFYSARTGGLMTGTAETSDPGTTPSTGPEYHIQSGSWTVTEDDVEEGTYNTDSIPVTGSIVDLAALWITSVGSTIPRLQIGLIVDGAVVEDGVGDYHTNSLSLRTASDGSPIIDVSIADDECLDYSDYTVHYRIVSH